jgi:anti-sigma B factor antagonist
MSTARSTYAFVPMLHYAGVGWLNYPLGRAATTGRQRRTSCFSGLEQWRSLVNIDVVERDGSLVLILEGELDIGTAPMLDQELERAEAGDAGTLVVDLDRVVFIDSTGLHVLIKHAQLSSQNGRRLRLTKGSPQVRRLFEITGTTDHLPFLPD